MMKMKYLAATAGLMLAAPAVNATVVTISYATENLGGPISGSFKFDTRTASPIVAGGDANYGFTSYFDPTGVHNYNLFGEELRQTFFIDTTYFSLNGSPGYGRLQLYNQIPDTTIAIMFALEWTENHPLTPGQLPSSGYEIGSEGFLAFVDLQNLQFAGLTRVPFSVSYANSVPEPATWAMMIGGMGMVGGTLRRRRTSHTIAVAA